MCYYDSNDEYIEKEVDYSDEEADGTPDEAGRIGISADGRPGKKQMKVVHQFGDEAYNTLGKKEITSDLFDGKDSATNVGLFIDNYKKVKKNYI